MLSTKNKLRVYLFSALIVLNAVLGIFYINYKENNPVKENKLLTCDVHGFRRTNYRFTKPLLMLDRECDDPTLDPLRQKVLSFVNQAKAKGDCEDASVYFRLLDSGRNFIVNEQAYSPGSMMKIMTLITILKSAERNPSVLEKRFTFNAEYVDMPHQEITTWPGLQRGKDYSVDQLLTAMIVESDNDATVILNSNMLDVRIYSEVLDALDLPIPDPHQADYPITTESLSRFFRLLYNSSFLSPEMSDKALILMTKSKYMQGICRYTDNRLTVAHKFGEKNLNGGFQLHEGGIFFAGAVDYLLIVMTKGKDQSKLQGVLADVSKLVLEDLIVNYGLTVSNTAPITEAEPQKNSTNITSTP